MREKRENYLYKAKIELHINRGKHPANYEFDYEIKAPI